MDVCLRDQLGLITHTLGIFSFFPIFWLHRVACRILVPCLGIELVPHEVQVQRLNTGPPRKSLWAFSILPVPTDLLGVHWG